MQEDNELMELVKQGDKAAYELLVHRYRRAGIAFAYQIIRDGYLAEDIVQDCFVRIYILRDRYKSTCSFKTYLFTLIKNRSIDYLRQNKYMQNLDDLEIAQDDGGIEQIIIEKESVNELFEQIMKLQGDYKQMLYLYAVEEQSYEQIAKIMKQTRAQVKIKLFRARQKLRLINEEGGCLEK